LTASVGASSTYAIKTRITDLAGNSYASGTTSVTIDKRPVSVSAPTQGKYNTHTTVSASHPNGTYLIEFKKDKYDKDWNFISNVTPWTLDSSENLFPEGKPDSGTPSLSAFAQYNIKAQFRVKDSGGNIVNTSPEYSYEFKVINQALRYSYDQSGVKNDNGGTTLIPSGNTKFMPYFYTSSIDDSVLIADFKLFQNIESSYPGDWDTIYMKIEDPVGSLVGTHDITSGEKNIPTLPSNLTTDNNKNYLYKITTYADDAYGNSLRFYYNFAVVPSKSIRGGPSVSGLVPSGPTILASQMKLGNHLLSDLKWTNVHPQELYGANTTYLMSNGRPNAYIRAGFRAGVNDYWDGAVYTGFDNFQVLNSPSTTIPDHALQANLELIDSTGNTAQSEAYYLERTGTMPWISDAKYSTFANGLIEIKASIPGYYQYDQYYVRYFLVRANGTIKKDSGNLNMLGVAEAYDAGLYYVSVLSTDGYDIDGVAKIHIWYSKFGRESMSSEITVP
jgi:hypothetical protein